MLCVGEDDVVCPSDVCSDDCLSDEDMHVHEVGLMVALDVT